MDWFKKIDNYYKEGLWTIEMIKNAVIRNKITEEQFKEITGQDYEQ